MELPVDLLLRRAPKRQRYARAAHILFGSGCGRELSQGSREQFVEAVAQFLREGLCVHDIRHFRECCAEHSDWGFGECPLSLDDEMAVSARAGAAVRAALSLLEQGRNVEPGFESPEGVTGAVSPKRSRFEMVELCELKEKLGVAEILADVRDYGAMSDVLKRICLSTQTVQQVAASSNRLPFIFTQLEIIRRTVELWLGTGDLGVVRDLVGDSTKSLIVDAAQQLILEHGSDSLCLSSQQGCTEVMTAEFEEFVLFFSLVRALCMFSCGEFAAFVSVFTASGLCGAEWGQIVEDVIAKRSTTALRTSFGSRSGVVDSVRTSPRLCHVVETSITTAAQLGVMVVLCAFAVLPRAQAVELVMRMDIVRLWENVPEAHLLVRSLLQAQFSEAFGAATVLSVMYLKTDTFAHKHNEMLLHQFKQTLVAGYAQCFERLDLRKASIALSFPLDELEQLVRGLIESERLHARIDFVSHRLNGVEEEAFDFGRTSGDYPALLECLHNSHMCTEELERSLRVASLRQHRAQS
ncbi:hypothetical protein ERJ75_001349800 [Trypanosoma vivax]|uniref:PCI domain-containing protein n=1 Tax=Trypanosoma vivax (strain Y486) TaxID=1055687 RepID=G0U5P8_TRYVY|nr:hypothetical protein TRVL_03269 [Trypanosoma vivax]KAH8608268.1 hypothetical protein ERJ75_001349800 [Trypanosoma vivax]CCC51199.1 conserved hypothetical protein [Trypanosoma vivax Y486]